MRSDEQEIRNLVANWLRASEAGNTDAVLELMAEDVVFLQPGQPPMRGRSAFREAQAGHSAFKIEAKSEIQEVRVGGDFAWCWNYLTVALTPKAGGETVRRAGHVLSVLQKQAGRWVIVRDANMLTRIEVKSGEAAR